MKRAIKACWAILRHRPNRIIIDGILKRSPVIIAIIIVSGYVGIASLFAVFYQNTDSIKMEAKDRTYINYLAFSIHNQLTISYNYAQPVNSVGYSATIAQSLTGLLYTTICFAVLIAQIIQRPNSLRLAKQAVYDPQTNCLRIGFWNRGFEEIYDAKVEVFCRQYPRNKEQRLISIEPVQLAKTTPTFLAGMWVVFCDTKSLRVSDFEDFLVEGSGMEMWVVITGISSISGSISLRHIYTKKDFRCGTFKSTFPKNRQSYHWRDREFQHFGKIEETVPAFCEYCVHNSYCKFRPLEIYNKTKK